MSRIIFLISMCFMVSAQAVEDARVLPKGIFRVREVIAATEQIKETFNEEGLLEPFAATLNRTVTMKDFMEAEPRLVDLVTSLNAITPGLGDQLVSSDLYADMELRAQTYVTGIEYGLTKEWTLGLKARVIRRSVNGSFAASGINNSPEVLAALGQLNPELTQGLGLLGAQGVDTAAFARTLFTSKGYAIPSGFDSTELGDLEIGAKYLIHDTKDLDLSAQMGIRLPTGKTPSLDNIFDKGTGEGAWVAGLQLAQQYYMTSNFSVNFFESFEHYFEDTRDRAVPNSPTDALPSLLPQDGQVQRTTRKLPLRVEVEVSGQADFAHKRILAWGGIRHKQQGAGTFTGPESDRLYYEGLGEGTGYSHLGAEIGGGYSGIPDFRAGSAPFPYKIKAQFNWTIAGVNIPYANYFRTDLIVFF